MREKNTELHRKILHAVVIDGKTPTQIAREQSVTRSWVTFILRKYYDVSFRPVYRIGNPAKIREILPEWGQEE